MEKINKDRLDNIMKNLNVSYPKALDIAHKENFYTAIDHSSVYEDLKDVLRALIKASTFK